MAFLTGAALAEAMAVQVLAVTLPIFLLIGLGYLVARRGLLAPDQVRGLGLFAINVAFPALLFRLLTRYRLREVLEWRYLLVYGAASLAVLVGGFLYWRRVAGCGRPSAAVRAFGMGAANTGFIGMPIAVQALGPRVGVAIALTIAVENVLMLPGLIVLGQEREAGEGRAAIARRIGRGLVTSPLVLAIAAAILAILLGVRPPAPLARAMDLLAGAAAPVALIVIGGSLVRLDMRGMGGAVVRIAAGKLVAMPALVFLLLLAVPIADPDLRHGALLLSAVPMASSYPVFGQRYGEAPLAAAALVVCTTAAFVTLNLVLWFIRAGWAG